MKIYVACFIIKIAGFMKQYKIVKKNTARIAGTLRYISSLRKKKSLNKKLYTANTRTYSKQVLLS